MNQQMDGQVIASSKALGTPLKQFEKTRRSKVQGPNMDIDEVHANKRPKLSSNNEAKVEKYYMIIYPVPESIEKVPSLKIDKIPSTVVLIEQEKLGTKENPKEQSKVDIHSHFEGIREKSIRSSFDLYSQKLEAKQIQPRVMSAINNEETTLDIALLDPK